jgi:osmotically inducible protein OsmC
MTLTRKASAEWQGTVKEGKGTLTTDSKVLESTQYSFKSRFEDGKGTNPEELIAAAHAGCFTMQLSALLSEEGADPTKLQTEAKVMLEDGEINKIILELSGEVEGIEGSKFEELANKAKEICPVSKLFKAEIELKSKVLKPS